MLVSMPMLIVIKIMRLMVMVVSAMLVLTFSLMLMLVQSLPPSLQGANSQNLNLNPIVFVIIATIHLLIRLIINTILVFVKIY